MHSLKTECFMSAIYEPLLNRRVLDLSSMPWYYLANRGQYRLPSQDIYTHIHHRHVLNELLTYKHSRTDSRFNQHTCSLLI